MTAALSIDDKEKINISDQNILLESIIILLNSKIN